MWAHQLTFHPLGVMVSSAKSRLRTLLYRNERVGFTMEPRLRFFLGFNFGKQRRTNFGHNSA